MWVGLFFFQNVYINFIYNIYNIISQTAVTKNTKKKVFHFFFLLETTIFSTFRSEGKSTGGTECWQPFLSVINKLLKAFYFVSVSPQSFFFFSKLDTLDCIIFDFHSTVKTESLFPPLGLLVLPEMRNVKASG